MEKLFEGQETLALFLIFFVPGFLMIKAYDLLVPSERRDFSKGVFEAVAYSAVNLAAFTPLIYLMRTGFFSPFWYWVWATVVLIVGPVVWALLFFRVRRSKWLTRQFPHPILRPWDYVFGQRECYWVIVHLKDRKIGGLFGPDSFASSDPAEPQIYLEELWALDANERFLHKIERSKGIIFFAKDIVAVELFSYNNGG